MISSIPYKENWDDLLRGIIEQACRDLHDIMTGKLKERPDLNKLELARFFSSEWCADILEEVMPNMTGQDIYSNVIKLSLKEAQNNG